jgi:hypothetical protein
MINFILNHQISIIPTSPFHYGYYLLFYFYYSVILIKFGLVYRNFISSTQCSHFIIVILVDMLDRVIG